ncbi:hypothetical protein D9M68_797900 [compost metagenome]
MAGFGDQHHLLLEHRQPVQLGVLQRTIHQRRVQAAAEHGVEQFAARRRLHLQVHSRPGAVVAHQHGRQVDGGRAEHRANDEIPRRFAAPQRRLSFRLQGEHALGVTQQHLARRGQGETLALPQE